MFDFFLLPGNLPFSVALLLMLMIGAAELIGLGASSVASGRPRGRACRWRRLLAWLGIGKVPLLIVLDRVAGPLRLARHRAAAARHRLSGGPLSPWLAAPAAFVGALPLTGIGARGLARILPSDETTAIGLGALLGRRAEIVIGESRRGCPARARVRDVHGQTHYVMVEPTDDDVVLTTGATALLVRREGELFFGLPDANPLLAAVD